MIGNDIKSDIMFSLLRGVSDVNRSNSKSKAITDVSFDDILNNQLSRGNGCNKCHSRGISDLDIINLVTTVMGNSSSMGSPNVHTFTTDTLSKVDVEPVVPPNNKADSEPTVSPVTPNKVDNVFTVSPTTSSKMDNAISLLKEQIGKPYVWGANGPNSFDCSGLTRYIYKEALGKDIPRVSYDQAKFGKAVDKKDLQPGDLVFFDTMNKGRVSHVGIYIGDGEFIHASNKRDGVKLSKLEGYYERTYKGARRP